MSVRTRTMPARLLPQGWRDLVRQLVLFCGAYWLYRIVRGLVDGRAVEAYENAHRLVDAERALGLFLEPAVHAWAEGRDAVITAASLMYLHSHFAVTVATLAFLYLRRNPSFYFVRNMFLVAMGLALVGYVAFPTAPPRLMPELGFSDSVAAVTGVDPHGPVGALYNPFAAVPSMHVAFALMLGVPMARMARRAWVAGAWRAYPGVVTFTVIATANHWWLDAALGAATALAAAWAARSLALARPHAWAWRPATAPVA